MFGNLKSDGLEESGDRLGGGGFQPLKSGIYTGPVKVAYAGVSAGGAKSLTVVLDLDGREYSETFWLTSATAKGGLHTYVVKDKATGKPVKNADGTDKRRALPGFEMANNFCLLATGEELADQAFEDKMVSLWDKEAGKKIPKSVPVAVDLIGKTISVGIHEILENKSELVNGAYVPSADTRVTNQIDKVFHTESQRTVSEIRAEATEGKFWPQWAEKNTGIQVDKRTIKDGAGTAGRPGVVRPLAGPPVAGAPAAPKAKSLFSKAS